MIKKNSIEKNIKVKIKTAWDSQKKSKLFWVLKLSSKKPEFPKR